MIPDLPSIWSRVLQGDDSAWQQLVDGYSGLIYTVALRTGLSTADAEDCAQQTWLALYRNRRKIKDPEALPAWLIKTTHRRAMQLYRKYASQPPMAGVDLNPNLQIDNAALPDEIMAELESRAVLEAAVAQLDGRCKKLVTWLFLSPGKISYNDVSRRLGVKPNSLGPLRSRCLNKLRKILKDMGYDTD
jgi:RNA polymerase sigma factor (sigma-70 family)